MDGLQDYELEPLVPPLETLRRVNISQMEVVRRQYLSHIKDNSVTIRPDGIQFNTACIVRMEDVVHIQMIIGRQQRWLVIRGCSEDDRDSQRWCIVKPEGRKPRKITGKDFSIRMYRMMGWNRGYYYRCLGSFAVREDKEDELLLVFELDESEKYPLTFKGRLSAGVEDDEVGAEELERLDAYEAAKAAEKAAREEAKKEGRKPKPGKKQAAYSEILAAETFGERFEDHVDKIQPVNIEELQGQMSMFPPAGT